MLRKNACRALFPLGYALLAVLFVGAVMRNGLWPAETNAMYSLYCGDLLYRSVGQGLGYPLYDIMWFAGSETLRGFGPVPACLLALCQLLTNGSNIDGAYLFLGLLFFVSACIWLYIGAQVQRPFLGGLLGILWFFLPYNLHTLLVQGDITRSIVCCALPLLFAKTHAYLKAPHWKKLPFFGICFLLLFLTHPGSAALSMLAWWIYLALWRFVFHGQRGIAGAPIAMCIFGMMGAGLWLLPYLTSGVLNGDFTEVMAASFQPILQSLNIYAYFTAPSASVYFGLALFILCVVAVLFGKGDSRTESLTAVVLLACTSTVCYAIMQIMPGISVFRGIWLFSAAAALALLALLYWSTARKALTILLTVLLLLDALPAIWLISPDDGKVIPAEDRMEEVLSATLRDEAQAVTNQRLAILDEDATGAEGIYLASLWQSPVPILGGIDRNQTKISENLTQLNRAVQNGCYTYVFDRCLEMGCDSVLLQSALIKNDDLTMGRVDQAARRLGYKLLQDNGSYRLYHCELGSSWGTVSKYPAIGIGTTAGYTSLVYPAMQETADSNLNHYTFEQLSAYELVLLSGFTYDDAEAAEDLVLRLSEAGVHVVIAADGIPLKKANHSREFLGVICNNIEFSNGYPELDTIDGILNTKLFPPEHSQWSTVYVEGLDDVWGYVLDNDLRLPFYGTVKNENIVFVALNLNYYYSLTKDESIETLLNHGIQLPPDRLPERMAVPLQIDYDRDTITLTTSYDNVNTGLSAHEAFTSSGIWFENNLTMISSGTTVITLSWPYWKSGLTFSILGILFLCALPLYARHLQNKRYAKSEKEEGQA